MNRIAAVSIASFLVLLPRVAFPEQSRCSSFESPDISSLGWVLVDQHKYEDRDLGASAGYLSEHGELTFFSYDLGFADISDGVVRHQLFEAIKSATKLYNVYEPQTKLTKPRYLSENFIKNMIASHPYVQMGIMFESSKEDMSSLDIVTVGTDGKCIFKMRYTSALSTSSASLLVESMTNFSKTQSVFFSQF